MFQFPAGVLTHALSPDLWLLLSLNACAWAAAGLGFALKVPVSQRNQKD